MTVRALHMRGDGRDEEVDVAAWQGRRLGDDELLWVDLTGSDGIDTVASGLGLPRPVVELLRHVPDAPDATVVEQAAAVSVVTPGDEPVGQHPVGLRVVMGSRWVITAHPEPIGFLEEHFDHIRDDRQAGLLTPEQFLAGVLDWLVDAFFRVASELDNQVDKLDDAALLTDDNLLRRLVGMRRRIARARRLVWSHREVFAEILRPDFMPSRKDGETAELAMVAERLERAADAVANAREMLIGTFDVHMTRTAQRTNDIMKVLTIASVILLPASVVAGVMGMNFQLGFFEDPNMFWLVIGAMVAIAIATVVFARVRGWL